VCATVKCVQQDGFAGVQVDGYAGVQVMVYILRQDQPDGPILVCAHGGTRDAC